MSCLVCCNLSFDADGDPVAPVITEPQNGTGTIELSREDELKMAAASDEPPPAQSSLYDVALQNFQERGIGLDLKMYPGHLTVVRIMDEGAVVAWNDSCPPELLVREHDEILAVNGMSSEGQGMLAELRKVGEAKISLRRPPRHHISIDKKGLNLGVQLKRKKEAKSLYIEDITEGRMKQWNAENPDRALEIGDCIVEVNGCSETALTMLQRIREDRELELVVLRDCRRDDAAVQTS